MLADVAPRASPSRCRCPTSIESHRRSCCKGQVCPGARAAAWVRSAAARPCLLMRVHAAARGARCERRRRERRTPDARTLQNSARACIRSKIVRAPVLVQVYRLPSTTMVLVDGRTHTAVSRRSTPAMAGPPLTQSRSCLIACLLQRPPSRSALRGHQTRTSACLLMADLASACMAACCLAACLHA
jgi:hypothetical protein